MRLPHALVFAIPVLLAAAPAARADEPSFAPGRVTQLTWVPLPTAPPSGGEPTTTGVLDPSLALLPMRLALIGDAFPVAHAFGDDSCAARASAAGNAAWGFPLQRQTSYAIGSNLVVHTFAQLGCAFDSGVGWGVTYAAPVAKKLWLVGAMGGYAMPGLQPGHTVLKTDARLDLVYRPAPDRAWAVGIGRRGLTLSGIW